MSYRRIGIRGTGSYLPERVLTNLDLTKILDSSDEWIFHRTVPIALDEAVRNGSIQKRDLVILNAFGGGLTWGSSLIRW